MSIFSARNGTDIYNIYTNTDNLKWVTDRDIALGSYTEQIR